MQLEERQDLLSRAAEAECTLQQCLAEAEADAATWREAVQHGLSQGEVWHCWNTSCAHIPLQEVPKWERMLVYQTLV